MKRPVKRPKRPRRPPLTEAEILAWADAFHERWGRWPRKDNGGEVIEGPLQETWRAVDMALRVGLRSLPGGSSLARLLAACRGVRNHMALPGLRTPQILAWADAHYQRTGTWPIADSGPIPGTHGETWGAVEAALWRGYRGLAGGSSLAQLLAEHRGVRNRATLPPLSEEQILFWADANYQHTGAWPTRRSGPIPGTNGDTWAAIETTLEQGHRGLAGGSSLAQLLAEHRGVRNPGALPPLSPKQILAWADAHHRRSGGWPKASSGPIPGTHGETWLAVQSALSNGQRGLVGGSSLAQLLAEQRGVRNIMALLPLSPKQILAWADAHHRRTGKWPAVKSGPIPEAPGETWLAVESALRNGARGLPGGSTLARLLAEQRGARNQKSLPRLTVRQIVTWARAHHRETGRWPSAHSGPVHGSGGETWAGIDRDLSRGHRGLPGGSSLARLLAQHGKSR